MKLRLLLVIGFWGFMPACSHNPKYQMEQGISLINTSESPSIKNKKEEYCYFPSGKVSKNLEVGSLKHSANILKVTTVANEEIFCFKNKNFSSEKDAKSFFNSFFHVKKGG